MGDFSLIGVASAIRSSQMSGKFCMTMKLSEKFAGTHESKWSLILCLPNIMVKYNQIYNSLNLYK